MVVIFALALIFVAHHLDCAITLSSTLSWLPLLLDLSTLPCFQIQLQYMPPHASSLIHCWDFPPPYHDQLFSTCSILSRSAFTLSSLLDFILGRDSQNWTNLTLNSGPSIVTFIEIPISMMSSSLFCFPVLPGVFASLCCLLSYTSVGRKYTYILNLQGAQYNGPPKLWLPLRDATHPKCKQLQIPLKSVYS